jgi:hypothetical protein
LATHDNEELRLRAIRSLGLFGHPDDYELLISGLKSENNTVLESHIWAIYEYNDLRAVPHLIPLLETKSEGLIMDVIGALQHLKNPRSFEALRKYSISGENKKGKEECKNNTDHVLKNLSLTWEEYSNKSDLQKQELMAGYIKKFYGPQDEEDVEPDDKLTHQEFIELIQEATEEGHFEDYGRSDLIEVATVEDIPLIQKLMAKLYLRVSDECLYETRALARILKRLAQITYRKKLGIVEKVESL